MNSYLCVSVTFLDPYFHGKGDLKSEWPPAPMRLYQALVAGSRSGYRERGWSNLKSSAFRWLEACAPPQIIAPEAREGTAYTLFVPNNDSDEIIDRQDRLTSKEVRPRRLVGGRTVYYIWPIADKDGQSGRSQAEIICSEAQHLLALGWGIDQVVGSGRILTEPEVAALPGRRWRPWCTHRPGEGTLRVPVEGSLQDLDEIYGSFVERIHGGEYRPPRKTTQFRTVHYLTSTTLWPRPYAAFELPDTVELRAETTASVAARLRSLTYRCAKSDTHHFPGGVDCYVGGYVDHNGETHARFSYLPVPTLSGGRAGMIRRFLIAEPVGAEGTHAQWAEVRLRHASLCGQGEREQLLLDLWRPSSARMIGRFVDEALTWSTVTPVILPGFDSGKYVKAERLFVKAIAQAAIPVEAIEAFTLRKAPFWLSAPAPGQYVTPDYIGHFSRWHAWIRFREPVPGPLAIGAGRHVGLGLFAADDGLG